MQYIEGISEIASYTAILQEVKKPVYSMALKLPKGKQVVHSPHT